MKPLESDQLKTLEELYSETTKGPWKSWIEGRDHESGSDFIGTSGNDIELIGASRVDQDFIAVAHSYLPRLIQELKSLRAERGN